VLKKIAVDILISDVSLIDGEALVRLAHANQPKTQIVWMAALQSPEHHLRPSHRAAGPSRYS
jgi:hypothetical protein